LLFAVFILVFSAGCSCFQNKTPEIITSPPISTNLPQSVPSSNMPVITSNPPSNIIIPPLTSPSTPALPPGIDLEFDTIGITKNWSEGSKTYFLQIIPNASESLIEKIYKTIELEIKSINFNQYFVIVAFMGYSTPGRGFEIKRIRQNNNEIYVMVDIQKREETSAPSATTPYHIVKVNKAKMTQSGKITFRLVDQNGDKKYETTKEIMRYQLENEGG
jgi:hypothetical protein